MLRSSDLREQDPGHAHRRQGINVCAWRAVVRVDEFAQALLYTRYHRGERARDWTGERNCGINELSKPVGGCGRGGGIRERQLPGTCLTREDKCWAGH